jgi:hypothetical protein
MNTLLQLELEKGYVSFRPVEEVSFVEFANLLCEAIKLACEQGAEKLLIDVSGLTGFESPTTVQRFFLAERLAAEATQPVKFVLVCRPDLIREDRYGVLIARNRGLLCNIFPSESEALEWLLAP